MSGSNENKQNLYIQCSLGPGDNPEKSTLRLQRIDIQSARFKSYKKMIAEIQKKYDESKYEVRAYVVGQEGRSTPQVKNSYNRVLMWGKSAITALSSAISIGTKFILGHTGSSANGSSSNPVLGKVVSSFVEYLNGKFSAVVIGVFSRNRMNKYENSGNYGKLDFASMESQVTVNNLNNHENESSFNEPGEKVSDVDEVSDVSAIALGSLKEDSPAFPGAVLLHAIHCFSPDSVNEDQDEDDTDDIFDNEDINDDTDTATEQGEEDMASEIGQLTMDKLRAGLRDLNVQPHQVFSDNELIDAVKTRVNVNPSDIFSFKQIEEDKGFSEIGTLKEGAGKVEGLEKQVADLEADNKKSKADLLTTTEKIRLGDLLDKAEKKGTVDKKQREYIMNKYDSVADADDPMSDEDMQTFVTNQKKQYQKDAEFFGGNRNKSGDDENDDKTDENDDDNKSDENDDDKNDDDHKTEDTSALDYFLQSA